MAAPNIVSDLEVALRFLVGITLISAAFPKLRNPAKFASGVIEYQILPTHLARVFGFILPILELSGGAFLVLGSWVRVVAGASALMFASFGVAVGVNLARKRDMPCFCFGATERLRWNTLARLGILFALGVLLAAIAPQVGTSFGPPWRGTLGLASSWIPLTSLVAFGLLMLEFVQVSPVVIKAWFDRPTRSGRGTIGVVWTREGSEE